jgi:alpha-2-macroglobulin-like protein
MSNRFLQRLGAFSLVLVSLAVLWRVSQAESPAPANKPATLTDTLGGADRYLTHLATDKPIYRPGETLYVRGVMLHHATRKPLENGQIQNPLIEIRGPKGDSVASGMSVIQDSVLGFTWPIPATLAGGEYTIHVNHPSTGHPPAERKFDVRVYRAPRLKTQIKFLRDGYGAADEVVATLHAERAEGGIPAGSDVTITARVDGIEVFSGHTKIDEQGNCLARFKLPAEIRRGEGTLVLAIADGGVVESASKTIPILLQTVDLTLYPEGGDLIAGVENRVYFEAFTPAKKPADLAGIVLDEAGQEVAKFRSEHEGRGRFSFTPQDGQKYTLKINEPSGIKTNYPLPAVKPQGVVLTAMQDAVKNQDQVKLSLAGPTSGKHRVTLKQREVELDAVSIDLIGGRKQEVSLNANAGAGVLTVTVWDHAGKPLAERLVFRQPAKNVNVQLVADSKQYTPGGKVKVTVKTLDDAGQPISAVVGVAVTDDSVLEMIDKREQAPRLPVMVLFEGEVKELADAHVYLDPTNPQAPAAVDLLLGTQGWRRFALVDTVKFAASHGDAARRSLALRIVTHWERLAAQSAPLPNRILEEKSAISKFSLPAAAPEAAAPPPDASAPVPEAVAAPAVEFAKPDVEQVANNPEPANDAQGGQALNEAKEEGPRAALADALGDAEANGRRRKQFGLQADVLSVIRNDFSVVRIYAHQVRSQRQPGERIDFTETLYWNAGLKTDDKGEATVEFGLNDSVSSFRLAADAFSAAGGLGASSIQIDSVEPFYLEPKLPLEVTMNDVIRAPIGVVNSTVGPLRTALTLPKGTSPAMTISGNKFDIPAGARVRQYLNFNVGKEVGETEVTIQGTAANFADQVTRKIVVRPLGFLTQLAHGGLLAADGSISHTLVIPDTLVPGSLNARVVVYPTPLANMTEALQALIQEPCGCFEQTSSTVYPLVMAQQYFMSHHGVDPVLIEKSSLILQTGYDRLRGFECKSGGFEWFGADPGHDALTAYGLLEFTDMAQVRHVDSVMLDRTRNWLLDQRDGKGGYLRKTHTLHTWIADPECANTYNTWAVLEAGVRENLSAEVKWVREAAEKTQNTYAIALAANVLGLAGDKEGENHLLDTLAGKQQADGSLEGATTSVIGSGGDALKIETTALAVTAWLKNPSYVANVEKSIKYLAESCQGGRYGSTQSTVLALRAIVAYDKSRAKPVKPGSLQLVVDGREVGEPVAFTKDTTGAIELPDLAKLLPSGEHQVEVKMNGGSPMPYTVTANYHSLKPNSAETCKLHLEVKLRDTKVAEGTATEANVVVINRTNEAVPTPIAIIGIPGGLEVRHDQLKELVKANKIAAYEVKGRDVVLYWRSLDKEVRVELPLSLIAAVPGTYTGPASRAYLYYTDELKQWVDGLQVEISAQGDE